LSNLDEVYHHASKILILLCGLLVKVEISEGLQMEANRNVCLYLGTNTKKNIIGDF
jgi:hypothetical protein